ncbi:hypothetical protein ABZX51_001676 [Aspergillus tubingensis]
MCTNLAGEVVIIINPSPRSQGGAVRYYHSPSPKVVVVIGSQSVPVPAVFPRQTLLGTNHKAVESRTWRVENVWEKRLTKRPESPCRFTPSPRSVGRNSEIPVQQEQAAQCTHHQGQKSSTQVDGNSSKE